MTQALGARAARGAAVTLVAQVIRIVIQIASVTILSRLLAKSDFGLFAMVTAVVGVGDLLRDFGLSSAAIQARTLSREQRDNLFWLNTAIGAALAGVCFAASGLVSAAYGQGDRLTGITRALAVTFLLNGMTTQYRASLTRAMRFRDIATVDMATPLAALLVAIGIGMAGGGPWALVGQQITSAAVGLAGCVAACGWLPRPPHRGAPMRGFLRFGISLLMSQLIGYVAKNVDTFTIGRMFGPQDAAYYTRAFQLLMNPLGQIRAPGTSVALPALSRARDDHRRFNQYAIAGQLTLAMPLTIVLAIVIGAAGPAIRVFLGTGWDASVTVLRWLAVAGLFQTLAFVGYWIYLARAKTRALMQYSVASALIQITCIVVGVHWGITGVAVGYAIVPIISWPLSLWWLSRATPVPQRAFYAGAMRLIGLGIAVGLAAWAAVIWAATWPELEPGGIGQAFAQLALAILAGLAVTALLAALVPIYRRDAEQIVYIVKLALPRKEAR